MKKSSLISNFSIKTAALVLFACSICPYIANLTAQDSLGSNSKPQASPQMQSRFSLTASPAYKLEISRLLLREANRVAKALNLPEKTPISARNIVKLDIFPPRLAKSAQGIGDVFTSNYIYAVMCGYKFSALQRVHLQQEANDLKIKYVLPLAQMDTNAAFQLATQFLTLASIDVAALNHNCRVHINGEICPDYEHFTPLYNITWSSRRDPRFGEMASVEVFLPSKSLMKLRVNNSEYILSSPIQITNPEFLAMPTNAPPGHFANFGLPTP